MDTPCYPPGTFLKGTKVMVYSVGMVDLEKLGIGLREVVNVTFRGGLECGNDFYSFSSKTGLEQRPGRSHYQIVPASPEMIRRWESYQECQKLIRRVGSYLSEMQMANEPTDLLRALAAMIPEK
jgi:hypothetical protein